MKTKTKTQTKKKSFMKNVCNRLSRCFRGRSPSPLPIKVHFDESDDEFHEPNARYATKYGCDKEHYLTEEEIAECYGPVNPNRELQRFVKKIYDEEFAKLYNENKSKDMRNISAKQEVVRILGTRKEFFARYQDTMDLTQNDQIIKPIEKKWFDDINKTYKNLSLETCLQVGLCMTTIFGIFLGRYFNMFGGIGKRNTRKKHKI